MSEPEPMPPGQRDHRLERDPAQTRAPAVIPRTAISSNAQRVRAGLVEAPARRAVDPRRADRRPSRPSAAGMRHAPARTGSSSSTEVELELRVFADEAGPSKRFRTVAVVCCTPAGCRAWPSTRGSTRSGRSAAVTMLRDGPLLIGRRCARAGSRVAQRPAKRPECSARPVSKSSPRRRPPG